MDSGWLASQLLERKLVSLDQLRAAQAQVGKNTESGDLAFELVATGAISEHDLLRLLGLHYQARYVTTEKLSQAKIPQGILDYLPLELCESMMAVPVKADKAAGAVSVVTSLPENADLVPSIQQASGASKVDVHIALEHAISAAIRKWYKGDIHAFARAEQLLNRTYPQLLDIYDQRTIELDSGGGPDEPLELADRPPARPSPALNRSPSQPAMPTLTGPHARPDLQTQGQKPSGRVGAEVAVSVTVTPQNAAAPVTPQNAAAPVTPQNTAAPIAKVQQPSVEAPTPAQPAIADPSAGRQTVLGTCNVLLHIIEGTMGWKQGHSATVSRLAGAVAAAVGLTHAEIYTVQLAALLHDVAGPADQHLTALSVALDPRLSGPAERTATVLGQLFDDAHIPQDVFTTVSAFRRIGAPIAAAHNGLAECPPSIRRGAEILAMVDAYSDLSNNPKAPGGRVHEHSVAIRRLQQGADQGFWAASDVTALGRVLDTRGEAGRAFPTRPRAMVIEPDPQQCRLLEHTLIAGGVEVRIAATTAQAARELLASRFDIIVSEVDVQPVDGFDFAERIRDDPRTNETPFIFLAQRETPQDRERAATLGAAAYVVKPFDPSGILDLITKTLGRTNPRETPT